MRLFAAVLPSAGAARELRDALAAVPRGEGLRWTAEEGWHFTLAFMGEVPDRLLPDLHARLARAASRTAPFALRLHGVGHFGDHALWTGPPHGLDSLRLLAERADAAARRAGIPMEQHRRYTPTSPSPAAAAAPTCAPASTPSCGFEGTPGGSTP